MFLPYPFMKPPASGIIESEGSISQCLNKYQTPLFTNRKEMSESTTHIFRLSGRLHCPISPQKRPLKEKKEAARHVPPLYHIISLQRILHYLVLNADCDCVAILF